MDSLFSYNTYVTGKRFIARTAERHTLLNLMNQNEHIVISSAPKTGKTSLVQQVLMDLSAAGRKAVTAEFSFLNVRSTADMMRRLGDQVIKTFTNTPGGYRDIVSRLLAGTHFIFDEARYNSRGEILSLNWDIDMEDVRAVLSLPFRLAEEKGQHLYLILEEFQNINFAEDSYHLLKTFEEVLRDNPREACSIVMVGSQVNAMKDIFHFHGFFHGLVEEMEIGEMDPKDVIDYAVKTFLSAGKVIDRDLMLGVCRLFRGNAWYIMHFCAICDSLSKGYIMEPILVEALDVIISIHEPRFRDIMNDLTTFQVSLLRAILDGNTKFSSSDIISRYNLNSSANVKRLKDALIKKEIVTFNENDDPILIDPLFEYWAGKYFYEIK